jgi:hypothetical protein
MLLLLTLKTLKTFFKAVIFYGLDTKLQLKPEPQLVKSLNRNRNT